tara:strand:- start:346 stop:513 length:168 start_codon:yes stop_codon:yes gene_type:complete
MINEYLGYTMIALPFIGLFFYLSHIMSLKKASFVFGGAFALTAWVELAANIIKGG